MFFFRNADLLCSTRWLLWVKWLGLFFSKFCLKTQLHSFFLCSY